jgi:hypothetical protein
MGIPPGVECWPFVGDAAGRDLPEAVHGHGDEIAGASLDSGPRDVMAAPAS